MKKESSFLSVCIYVAAGVFLGFFLKFFVMDVLHIYGTSMEPQFKNEDKVVVSKLAYGINKPFGDRLLVKWASPKPGDVIIFMYDNKIVIKRCVATGGTALEYSYTSGYNLIIGDKNIPLTELQYHRMKDSLVVPEGMVLAVGDNYSESIDSRTYGFVPEENILGKVICR